MEVVTRSVVLPAQALSMLAQSAVQPALALLNSFEKILLISWWGCPQGGAVASWRQCTTDW